MDIEFVDSAKIYRGIYKEDFATKLINHMRSGKSFGSFAGTILVSPKTATRWLDEHPSFREAFEVAESLNMGVWEDIAIDQANGETKGNSSTTTFMMKNLHASNYVDKQVIENDGNVVFQISTGVPDSLEELNKMREVEAEEVIDITPSDGDLL